MVSSVIVLSHDEDRPVHRCSDKLRLSQYSGQVLARTNRVYAIPGPGAANLSKCELNCFVTWDTGPCLP